MIESLCDAWCENCDALCITTNGVVKKNGRCVMGRGIARQARDTIPDIDLKLGELIKTHGNKVHLIGKYIIGSFYKDIISFPTKNVWWEQSNINLIEQSTKQLVQLTNTLKYDIVLLPRPGCSNGGLCWCQVKPIIEPYLDDRFIIITNGT